MDDFYSPTLTIWLGKWGDMMYEYEQSILWMRGCACICVCSCSVSEHRLHRFFSWQHATVAWAAISALTQPRHEEVEKNKLQAICKPVRRPAGPCEAIYPLLEPQPGLAHAANAALHTGAILVGEVGCCFSRFLIITHSFLWNRSQAWRWPSGWN